MPGFFDFPGEKRKPFVSRPLGFQDAVAATETLTPAGTVIQAAETFEQAKKAKQAIDQGDLPGALGSGAGAGISLAAMMLGPFARLVSKGLGRKAAKEIESMIERSFRAEEGLDEASKETLQQAIFNFATKAERLAEAEALKKAGSKVDETELQSLRSLFAGDLKNARQLLNDLDPPKNAPKRGAGGDLAAPAAKAQKARADKVIAQHAAANFDRNIPPPENVGGMGREQFIRMSKILARGRRFNDEGIDVRQVANAEWLDGVARLSDEDFEEFLQLAIRQQRGEIPPGSTFTPGTRQVVSPPQTPGGDVTPFSPRGAPPPKNAGPDLGPLPGLHDLLTGEAVDKTFMGLPVADESRRLVKLAAEAINTKLIQRGRKPLFDMNKLPDLSAEERQRQAKLLLDLIKGGFLNE